MKNKLVIIGLLGSMSYLPVISAQPNIDTDGDGAVSFEELQAARPDADLERFNQVDADGDGLVTREERRQGRQERAQQRFSETDTDGSGGLSFEEIQARRADASEERFARMDRDGNGEIGQDEARAARKNRMQRGGGNSARGSGQGHRPRGGQRGGPGR